jgi:hypothetical protein
MRDRKHWPLLFQRRLQWVCLIPLFSRLYFSRRSRFFFCVHSATTTASDETNGITIVHRHVWHILQQYLTREDALVLDVVCVLFAIVKNQSLDSGLLESAALLPQRLVKSRRLLETLTKSIDKTPSGIGSGGSGGEPVSNNGGGDDLISATEGDRSSVNSGSEQKSTLNGTAVAATTSATTTASTSTTTTTSTATTTVATPASTGSDDSQSESATLNNGTATMTPNRFPSLHARKGHSRSHSAALPFKHSSLLDSDDQKVSDDDDDEERAENESTPSTTPPTDARISSSMPTSSSMTINNNNNNHNGLLADDDPQISTSAPPPLSRASSRSRPLFNDDTDHESAKTAVLVSSGVNNKSAGALDRRKSTVSRMVPQLEDETANVAKRREILLSALIGVLSKSSNFRLITLQLTVMLLKELVYNPDSPGPNVQKHQAAAIQVAKGVAYRK